MQRAPLSALRRRRRQGFQRWHLSAALAGGAVLAAILVPDISGARHQPGPPELTVETPQPVLPPPPDSAVHAEAGPISVRASLDQSAVLQGTGSERYLVVELEAPADRDQPRLPVHVSVVMDTSGSMAGRGKITNARQAAQELVGMLGPHDTFSLVTFDDQAKVVVPAGPVHDKSTLQRRIGSISTGGGTNLYDGLVAGQGELQSVGLEGVRRVVLLSDGKANIGISDDASLRRQAGALVHDGVSVSALGLGLDFNEDLLAAMSTAGGGRYRFVDRPGMLAEVFTEELQRIGKVVAREASLELSLPPGVVIEEIFGYDGDQAGQRSTIFLGDLHAGERRKVVARVRLPASQSGTVDIAEVGLAYTVAETGAVARAEAQVQALVTEDTRVVKRSVNKAARGQAVRVEAAKLVDEGARAWAAGDLASNQASYRRAEKLLRDHSVEFEDAEVAGSLQQVEEQRVAFGAARPASAEGAATVKRAKEAARADSIY